MNSTKQAGHLRFRSPQWIYARGIALLSAFLLASTVWCCPSWADEPSDSSADEYYLQIYRVSGQVSIQSIDADRPRHARAGDKLRLYRDTLVILPNNKAWAALQLVRDGVVQSYAGLLIKTIPSWQGASYTFPCTVSGNFHITWRPIVKRGRACGGGLMFIKTSQLSSRPLGVTSRFPISIDTRNQANILPETHPWISGSTGTAQ